MKLLLALLLSLSPLTAAEPSYDPLRSEGQVDTHLLSFRYGEREVPLKVYLRKNTKKPAPVVLLSHGLGGSREVGAYLGQHWAGRGYLVVAMQHPGSDDSVWKNLAPAQRRKGMEAAANGQTFLARMKDVPATLDQLEEWNKEQHHLLHGRTDLENIGLAGHSYGAVTTQALAGQEFGKLGPRFQDSRIDAALALSPSKARRGTSQDAFGKITLPMMLMTGTKDSSMIGKSSPESRLEVYAALPPGSKYQLVLHDAEHMAFSDRTLRGKEQRNQNHHRVILALSTAFWDAHLRTKKPAQAWLLGDQPKKLLEPKDRWEHK